jgi:EAL domain-containing protein (putative c-di-GMP-specific phosphodiesterase class I)
LLPPGRFLDQLAGTDLEKDVGTWVIDTALAQISAWQSAGLAITVSANISADHLLRADFAPQLQAALARHPDVSPAHLELEILETAALSDTGRAADVLRECQALGICIALDDFGTGYSSLTYFRKLPIDILKIDQSFVLNMLANPEDRAIVETVVRLAQAFDCGVIAEGVETAAHGEALLGIGCVHAQGYGIARPMPPANFLPWAAQWQAASPA